MYAICDENMKIQSYHITVFAIHTSIRVILLSIKGFYYLLSIRPIIANKY